MPKTPQELKEQIETANAERPAEVVDTSLTAEGLKVPNPTRADFFGNLDRVSEPSAPDEAIRSESNS